MKRLLKTLFNIEPDEISRGLLMFVYIFLVLSAYLILKPVRNSLFLVNFSAEQLPIMYMFIAVAAAPITTLYGRFAARTTLPRLIGGTTIIIVINLAMFWWLITAQFEWLVYLFYVWVSLFGVFTTSQFWLMANYVFDAREAKRLFPFAAAGAIAGGIVGSKLTNLFADVVGTENLLWVCAAFMTCCFFLLLFIWPKRKVRGKPDRRRRKGHSPDASGMMPIIMRSNHLKLLTGIIAVTVIVSTFVDWQFNTVVANSFENKDQLTAFFGDFFFYLSIASLVLQLLFSSRILKRFGVGIAILFLPVALLLGSAAIFLWPVLASAIAVKMSDGSFRYSINKSGFELLYLPIPVQIKDRVKAYMDVVGDRFARGIGGALLYVTVNLLNWSVQTISLISGGLIGIWIVLGLLIRREYSRSFKAALENRILSSDQVRTQLVEARSIHDLVHALNSGDRKQVLFVLELTSHMTDHRLIKPLLKLLEHDDSLVRRMAVANLCNVGDESFVDQVKKLLNDPDPSVRREAIHYLCVHHYETREQGIEEILDSDDPVLRGCAFRCVFTHHLEEDAVRLLTLERAMQVLNASDNGGSLARRELSAALTSINSDSPLAELVPRLLADSDPAVRKNALLAAARLQMSDMLPAIVGYLADPTLRKIAMDALVQFGAPILPALQEQLQSPVQPILVKKRLPKAVSLIGTDTGKAILMEELERNDGLVRHQVIKALNRLRRRENIPFDRSLIDRHIRASIKECYRLALVEQSLASRHEDDPSYALIRRTVRERRQIALEQAFRFLGLIYAQQDMITAYNGLTSRLEQVRAGALEFVDTVWQKWEKEMIFPLFEAPDELARHGRRLFGLKILTADAALELLLLGDDPLLAAGVSLHLGRTRRKEFRESLARLKEHDDPVLVESVNEALRQIDAA